jgi:PAS domain S-box-containing protein
MYSISPELARSALDAAPDAMIIIEVTGVIAYSNRQASALFGYPHDDIIGISVERLMPERFRVKHVGHRLGYVDSPRARPMGTGLWLFGKKRDGVEFPIEISLSPLQDGPRTLIAAAIRDVSDSKRAEEELVVARDASESMREIAERANASKSRFLATASHDLRQPLQTLGLLNASLKRMVSAHPLATEALTHQEHAISAMARLLNALLDITKLESGATNPEPMIFDLGELFDELKLEFGDQAAEKGLRFEVVSNHELVNSDPSLLEQVLRNLVSNAVKYTSQGSIRLEAEIFERSVLVHVVDTGIGIATEHLRYIYDEFYQIGVASHSARDGYGLGLSIVQRIAALLDLDLKVESSVGRGSRFSLRLTKADGTVTKSVPGDAIDASSHDAGSDAQVLIVEDNMGVRNATRLLLELEGYGVSAVGSLKEAADHVRAGGAVDLLVTDYHLDAGETGTEVISELRRILARPLPAILITGDTSAAIKHLPCDQQLQIASKPINAEELLRKIVLLLPSRRSQRL